MSEKMVINSLVPPTWNRLKVNEYELELPGSFESGTAVNSFAVAGVGVSEEIFENETGCGSTLSDVIKSQGIEAKSVALPGSELVTAKICYEKDSADIICIKVRDGQTVNILTDVTSKEKKAAGVLQIHITAGKDSVVNLSQIIRPGKEFSFVNDIGATLEEGAQINLSQVFAGEGNIVSGYKALLSGEKSSSNVYAGLVRKDSQKIDMNYVMKHTGKSTKSETYISGALLSGGSKTFRGSIDFVKGCAGAEGAENENMLLLDDTVVNKTVPLILCDEEDVAGSHGASIGKPADEMLYYMMSRGITKETALKMLEKASLSSVVPHIADEKAMEYVSAVIDEMFEEN